MKTPILISMALMLSHISYAQETKVKTEKLSEVTVLATNYKYFDNVTSGEEAAIPVDLLERKVASFDVKGADFYSDDYDLYHVSFFIPDGKILVAYDKDGKVLRTVEKFKDVDLPDDIRTSVSKRFPN